MVSGVRDLRETLHLGLNVPRSLTFCGMSDCDSLYFFFWRFPGPSFIGDLRFGSLRGQEFMDRLL